MLLYFDSLPSNSPTAAAQNSRTRMSHSPVRGLSPVFNFASRPAAKTFLAKSSQQACATIQKNLLRIFRTWLLSGIAISLALPMLPFADTAIGKPAMWLWLMPIVGYAFVRLSAYRDASKQTRQASLPVFQIH